MRRKFGPHGQEEEEDALSEGCQVRLQRGVIRACELPAAAFYFVSQEKVQRV